MEGRKITTEKIVYISTARRQQDITRNTSGPHQAHGIQQIYHDIQISTHKIPPPRII